MSAGGKRFPPFSSFHPLPAVASLPTHPSSRDMFDSGITTGADAFPRSSLVITDSFPLLVACHRSQNRTVQEIVQEALRQLELQTFEPPFLLQSFADVVRRLQTF
ncbi:hypothetical protein LXL04_001802 [Taraxacum kok-saghyz]